MLRIWNWEVFGDINRKEEDIMAKIEYFQGEQEKNWNAETYNKLTKYQSELENIHWMKEGYSKRQG